MGKIQEIIFDLDGTLWDNTAGCARVINWALQEEGIRDLQVTAADTFRFMGLNPLEIQAQMFPEMPREKVERILQRVLDHEVNFLSQGGPSFYPGVKEKMEQLAQRYRLFIVSNCQQNYLQAFLDEMRVHYRRELFCDWECFGNSPVSKGENIKKVMARSSIVSAVYIGDTHKDWQAADEAGLPFHFASYGFGQTQNFDHSHHSFLHVVDFFLSQT